MKLHPSSRALNSQPLAIIVNDACIPQNLNSLPEKTLSVLPQNQETASSYQHPAARYSGKQPLASLQLNPKRVPLTDPDQTSALWARVQASRLQNMPPNLRSRDATNDAEENSHNRGLKRQVRPGARGSGGRVRTTGRASSRNVTRGYLPFTAAGRGTGREASSGSIRDNRGVSQDDSVDILTEQFDLHDLDAEELADTPSIPQSGTYLAPHTAVDSTITKLSRVTARDVHFEERVLRPRRIIIDNEQGSNDFSPFKHFGTDTPPKGEAINYAALDGLDAAQIWLTLNDEVIKEIIQEYNELISKAVCEEEYVAFAMEMFLKRQRRFHETPSDRKWRAERMLQLVTPPTKDQRWGIPVLFEKEIHRYEFNLRPDCSYWLSLAGFNEDYRSEVGIATYVHKDWITCPYFTIEFKKHNESDMQTRAQVAAAGALALYNRYTLRERALRVARQETDEPQVRHYGLTMVGANFELWVLQANPPGSSGSWNGCTMKMMYDSSCRSRFAIRQLRNWINEIHRWGLTKHAAGCQDDIMIILEAKGVDTSIIDLD